MSIKTTHPDQEPFDKVTISLPHWLLARIDEKAKEDDRSRSNWIARRLAEIVELMNGNDQEK